MSPARQRRSPAERARQVILDDFDIGPKYVRLSAADRASVDALLEAGEYRRARREIVRLDELRRLQRRERDRQREGVLNGVIVDASLMPLNKPVPLKDHETRGQYSLFPFDYQCRVTVKAADGTTRILVTDNLGFEVHPIKEQIVRRAIRNIAARLDGEIPGSPDSEHMKGTITRVALLIARRRG